MKRVLSITLLLSLAVAVPVFAAQGDQPQNPQGQTFEQRQARILQMIDARIASMQEGRTCVQNAKNDNDLQACREKHRAEMRDHRGEMGPGMMGGGGPRGPQ